MFQQLLSTQDNTKLLLQLKSGFKRTISWNKYLSNSELLVKNPDLNQLVETSFQGVNKLAMKMIRKEQAIKDAIFQMQK